ncbi:MAG: TetR/AcrR family transcriptional regulator [Xanthomonadales bacterium]|nr:TetR/AcrR family transcriptional regulator [Xanthomonadales bacterium]MDH4020134.1 TetR/AcrR family transcriptional regulator [Xanthomonadales bacterium]
MSEKDLKLVHKPKQDRSKDTQEKLLTALESLLEERFFEQITIRDIAQRAGLSSGTIYRRFQNKEALLPILYERYDHRLGQWAGSVWQGKRLEKHCDLESRINWLVKEHVRFYKESLPILRTVYVYNRLHGEVSLPNVEVTRRDIYTVMLDPLWECLEQKAQANLTGNKVRCLILILITTINERFLFEKNTPSSILKLDEKVFIRELTNALKAYLQT